MVKALQITQENMERESNKKTKKESIIMNYNEKIIYYFLTEFRFVFIYLFFSSNKPKPNIRFLFCKEQKYLAINKSESCTILSSFRKGTNL